MSAPVQRPAFLAAVPQHGEARPPSFLPAQRGRGAARPSRPGTYPGASGPSAEEMEAVRAEALQRVAHGVEVLRLQGERLAEQVRSDALEIGFLVARRILDTELTTSPDALFALVRGAVRKAGDTRHVAIRVHPDDLKLVEGAVASGEAGITAARVEVLGDGSLERGDCVVDTDFGSVDGRLRTRFEELYRAARSALEEGAA
jgi:flagellar assembly protein FliH